MVVAMTNDPEKAALAEEAAAKARRYEVEYGSCPQCVLLAIQETVGGVDDATIKAVHGLAGGGALSGEGLCGALVGGLVAVSLRRGRARSELARGRFMANYQQGRELMDAFRAELGGVTCQDLQRVFGGRTYDLWQTEEYQAFREARGDGCADATAWVARWVVGRP
jgi:C_GCAxxG_C_C family probable redox protein